MIKLSMVIMTISIIISTTAIKEPSIYAAIEEVEESAESICANYQGEWEDGSCEIGNEEQKQEFMDDVASLEDSICNDNEPKDIDYED